MNVIEQALLRARLAWERIDYEGFDPYGLEHPDRRTEPCRRCGRPRPVDDRPQDDFDNCTGGPHE